jgi:hypothetical protein
MTFSRANFVLSGIGLASAIFLVLRVFGTWRVSSPRAPHEISVFGQTFSYPTANIDLIVIVIVLLAAVGASVVVLTLAGAAREARASRRFQRRFACQDLEVLLGARLIVDRQPRAFCAGLLRPRV